MTAFGKDNPSYRHGMTDTPEFRAWTNMLARCTNKTYKPYPRYGGRGIKVCDRWLNSFEDFFADMGERPSPQHSLDRWPDNNGNYEPENCRWATRSEQNSNRRNNRIVKYRGKEMSLPDAIRASGNPISIELAHYRVNAGWTIARALDTPARHYNPRP
jgi:hypothetical protein